MISFLIIIPGIQPQSGFMTLPEEGSHPVTFGVWDAAHGHPFRPEGCYGRKG